MRGEAFRDVEPFLSEDSLHGRCVVIFGLGEGARAEEEDLEENLNLHRDSTNRACFDRYSLQEVAVARAKDQHH